MLFVHSQQIQNEKIREHGKPSQTFRRYLEDGVGYNLMSVYFVQWNLNMFQCSVVKI